ncbi:MAG: Fic family protein [Patescibacteria group bacterium]|nr:Fic family protein [Patescibacteria group bacterium]MDD4304230.1 Fic family protein [Patescibacteria group bacterium]MDD4695284.1 Fic family protein [Patescibacteria group bacterium]
MEKDRFYDRIKLNQEILGKITKIDEFKGLWRGSLKLNPQILGRLKSSVIITSTGASTRIEGSKMTDEEVARLLRGLKLNPPKNRDEEEVAGYADLLGKIFDNYNTLKLTENNILQFHSILLQFSKKDQSHLGKYKSSENTVIMKNETGEEIVLFNPTKPYLVKPEMESIISWTNEQFDKKELHPILIIANFIFEFLAIHPFLDGNGRLSRALTNLLLLRNNYAYVPYISIDEIIEDNKDDYYLSLRATQKNHKTKNEDITPWLSFFLDKLFIQAEKAKELMNLQQPEKLLSGKQEIVFELLKNGETLSVSEINEKLNNYIPLVTIKQALRKLLTLRLVERIGQGRSTRYKIIK